LKKILISAGEASGDFYGAELAKQILKTHKNRVKIIGFGGAKMRAAGVDVKIDLVKHAVMGFWEVVKKLSDIVGVFNRACAILNEERPDALVVIDYPGFNLSIVKKAKALGVKKIIYYITPQVWVWKYNRIFTIKKHVDLCVVVLPFEKRIFEKEGIKVRYFGHPMAPYLTPAKPGAKEKLIGIFPGSRENEVKSFMEDILKACALIKLNYKNASFVLFQADTIKDGLIKPFLEKYPGLKIRTVSGWDIRTKSSLYAAIAKSGTTTLELALMGVPMAVVYRLAEASYWIIRSMAKGKYVSLPNIILDKPVVKEFIQHDFKAENVSRELLRILNDAKYAASIKKGLSGLNGSNVSSRDVVKNIAEAVSRESGL
jgi:lipid-A-disaccharide synthase